MDVADDTQAEPQLPSHTLAEGLWFTDCGLVLQAEHTVYRISGEYLAIHSPIFRDMLLLPPPEDAETFDGCPLVRLPDSAEDVTNLLKALLYCDFFEPTPSPTTFPILASILRMSHKYEIDKLYKRALAHISALHPTTLSESSILSEDKNTLVPDLNYDSNLVTVVLLARQFSLDWLLPGAFYRLSRFAWESLVILGAMSAQDKIRWMVGCRVLETIENSRILNFLRSPDLLKDCSDEDDPTACLQSRLDALQLAEDRRNLDAKEVVNLPLEIWSSKHWDGLEVCEECLEGLRKMHEEDRVAFWNRLPKIFDLPDWSKLQKMKADALR